MHKPLGLGPPQFPLLAARQPDGRFTNRPALRPMSVADIGILHFRLLA